MTAAAEDSSGAAAYPDPQAVAARIRRPGSVDPDQRVAQAECLWCARTTGHVPGPVTQVGEGVAQVRWWSCVECSEGRTLL